MVIIQPVALLYMNQNWFLHLLYGYVEPLYKGHFGITVFILEKLSYSNALLQWAFGISERDVSFSKGLCICLIQISLLALQRDLFPLQIWGWGFEFLEEWGVAAARPYMPLSRLCLPTWPVHKFTKVSHM